MINLTDKERRQVESFIRRGKAKARSITRARILLKSADGWSIAQIVAALEVSAATVSNVRKRYCAGGVEGVLREKVQQKRRHALGGEEEALLVAIACSPVPDGHDHWTLRMLRDKLVELDVVESISAATVQARLKKMNLSPGNGNTGVSRK
ncbi:MAG: helix-turn-helix domain-containing protein [Anaerolineae bacterium]